MNPATVLLWTHEEDHEELIAYNLIKAGYVVASVGAEEEIVSQARELKPAVVVMGDCSSDKAFIKIVKKVRRKVRPRPVFVCLTTKDEPSDKICKKVDVCLGLPAKPKKIVKVIQKAQEKRAKKKKRLRPEPSSGE